MLVLRPADPTQASGEDFKMFVDACAARSQARLGVRPHAGGAGAGLGMPSAWHGQPLLWPGSGPDAPPPAVRDMQQGGDAAERVERLQLQLLHIQRHLCIGPSGKEAGRCSAGGRPATGIGAGGGASGGGAQGTLAGSGGGIQGSSAAACGVPGSGGPVGVGVGVEAGSGSAVPDLQDHADPQLVPDRPASGCTAGQGMAHDHLNAAAADDGEGAAAASSITVTAAAATASSSTSSSSAARCIVCMDAAACVGLRHGWSVHRCVCVGCAALVITPSPSHSGSAPGGQRSSGGRDLLTAPPAGRPGRAASAAAAGSTSTSSTSSTGGAGASGSSGAAASCRAGGAALFEPRCPLCRQVVEDVVLVYD